MYEQFIRDRITQLRMSLNKSERGMSLDLGHSSSYIKSISSGRALPSMSEFLYICEYFSITPQEFFDDGVADPAELREAIDNMKALPPEQFASVAALLRTMNNQS